MRSITISLLAMALHISHFSFSPKFSPAALFDKIRSGDFLLPAPE
jgi:hypothetical protein